MNIHQLAYKVACPLLAASAVAGLAMPGISQTRTSGATNIQIQLESIPAERIQIQQPEPPGEPGIILGIPEQPNVTFIKYYHYGNISSCNVLIAACAGWGGT